MDHRGLACFHRYDDFARAPASHLDQPRPG